MFRKSSGFCIDFPRNDPSTYSGLGTCMRDCPANTHTHTHTPTPSRGIHSPTLVSKVPQLIYNMYIIQGAVSADKRRTVTLVMLYYAILYCTILYYIIVYYTILLYYLSLYTRHLPNNDSLPRTRASNGGSGFRKKTIT